MHRDVVVGWLAHSGEGVEQMKIAIRLAKLVQHLRHRHHAAATPNAALDNISFDPCLGNIANRLTKTMQSLGRGHREVFDLDDRIDYVAIHIGRIPVWIVQLLLAMQILSLP